MNDTLACNLIDLGTGIAFHTIPPIQTDGLRSIGETFQRNITRVKSHSIFPPMVLNSYAVYYQAKAGCLLEVTGGIHQIAEDDPRSENVQACTDRRLFDITQRTTPEDTYFNLRNACHFIEGAGGGPEYFEGLEAWIPSIAVLAWTTFETLAGDLREAALNAHPQGLVELKGASRRIVKAAGGQSERTSQFSSDESKSVGLNWLHRYQYDLRNKMGTALRERFRFDSLDGTRVAYAQAFEKDSDRIDAILASKELDALNLVRNLLVHRSGAADARYLRHSRGLPNCPRPKKVSMYPSMAVK